MARAKKPPTKPGTTAARATTSAQSDGDPIALLESLKDNLQATRRKLMRVQPDGLDDEQHEQWSEQIFQVNLAISTVCLASTTFSGDDN